MMIQQVPPTSVIMLTWFFAICLFACGVYILVKGELVVGKTKLIGISARLIGIAAILFGLFQVWH
jgi:hypothetical protein